MIDHYVNDSCTGEWLRLMADDSHPVDRHCACGRVLLNPHSLACEVCDPTQLPSILQRQAA